MPGVVLGAAPEAVETRRAPALPDQRQRIPSRRGEDLSLVAVRVIPVRRFAGGDDLFLRHGKDQVGEADLLLHEGPGLRLALLEAALPTIGEGEAGQHGVAHVDVNVDAGVVHIADAEAGG